MARSWVTNIFKQYKARSKKTSSPAPTTIWQNPLHFLAFGFGSGAIPLAPGTFGTLMAIPFYLLLQPLPLLDYLLFVLFFIIVSSWICDRVSREIQAHDHPGMCIDEFAGFFVTMINAPPGWAWVAIGFILFRLFDIWKPWPIRLLDQHVQGGFGIVLDDIVAGIYSFIIIQIIRYYT